MPNSATAKIKSAHKPLFWIFILGAFLVALVAAYLFVFRQSPQRYMLIVGPHKDGQIASDNKTSSYKLTPAKTAAEQERGLSGTKRLASDQGMVFLYDTYEEHCFWMKDMHYSLDIIWVDDAKRVTAIEHNVPSNSYPQTFCHPSRSVIELNAGEAARAGIQEGQRLKF